MLLDRGLNLSWILITLSIDVYIIKALHLILHLCLILFCCLPMTGNKYIYHIRVWSALVMPCDEAISMEQEQQILELSGFVFISHE